MDVFEKDAFWSWGEALGHIWFHCWKLRPPWVMTSIDMKAVDKFEATNRKWILQKIAVSSPTNMEDEQCRVVSHLRSVYNNIL